MQLFQLVRYLDENAIHLVVEEGRLRVTGGQELLTADVVAALKKHRDALLALVASEIASGPPAFADVSEAPLSFAQRRMYFLHQYDPLATHFILPVEMALHGPLHGERFVAALERVVARHRIYRTTYFVQDGVASQRFRGDLTFRVEQVDLSGCGTASAEAELENQRDRVMHRPFDLADELPIRASLLRLADDHHVFMLGFHHIATDEWSIQQFVAELAKTYRSLDGEGQGAPEAALPPSYLDYAAWQVQRFAAGALEPARSYWAYTLHGAKGVLELPLDHPRPAQQGYRGRLLERKLPGALQQRVAAFAREHRSSEYACYLGAYALLLSRLTGERDLVIGTDVYGREHPGTQDTAGFFVNQLALRCVVPIGASVEGYLEGVQETVKDALDYQEMPFDQLVDDLGVERDPAFPPLFQVKFLYARDSRDLEQFDGITLRERASDTVLSQYDLTLKVSSEQVKVWFNRDLLRVETVARWLDMYFALLEECLQHPAADVDGTLGHVLEQQLLPLVRGEHVEVDATRLFEGLDQSVERTPDAIAVRSPVGDLSYSQLQTMVGRIASRLSRMGMRPGDRVGVYLERSPEMAAAVIAVLRTGGVLVPLDSSYPADHTEHTLADSSIAIIITRSSLSDYLPEFFGFTLDVETLGEHDTFDDSYPVIDPESPAYLLYTSGSTGLPKGVFISHRAFANLCDWYVRFAELDAASRLLLMIPIGFDASLKNIVAPVIAGGQLILAPAEGFDPAGLLDVIATAGVSTINCAPSAAYALLREAQRTGFHSLASMRLLALGGEALDRSQLSPWLSSEVCNSRVANIYGPTECADISVAFVADKAQWLALPQVVIGRPIQNTRAYVLDGSQRLCPRGVVGELVMVGDGVGLGYHQRPELTGKSFVALPVLGGRGYLTGDYCRYDADGNLVYLGRRDGQIKIRGKRVELGEIVHHITALLPGRNVSIQVLAERGTEMLLAFVDGGQAEQTADQLRAKLWQQLPRHMVPAHILFVDTMPLTPNGKVCRTSLLEYFQEHQQTFAPSALELDPIQELIAEVWRKLLHAKISRLDDDFFSLGGDSILSIQAVAELRQAGMDVSVADIFKYPSLRQLAHHLSETEKRIPAGVSAEHVAAFALVPAADREVLPEGLEDAYPVTPLQMGMLFHGLLDKGGGSYHDVFSFELQFAYDEAMFVEAIEAVVAMQPVLRTGFDLGSYSVPLQLVHADAQAWVEQEDLSALSPAAQAACIEDAISRIKATVLDLRGPTLIRFTLLKLADDRIQCIVDAHHAILDGWSMATVQRQILELYHQRREGAALADVFDAGGLRFADYVASSLDDERDAPSIAWWDGFCSSLPPLPQLRPAPGGGHQLRRHHYTMPGGLARGLESLASREGVQLKTLMLMAHGQVLRAVMGGGDVLSGMTDHGRPEAHGGQNLVGLFLNVTPVLIRGGTSWRGLARELTTSEADAKPYRRHALASVLRRNPHLSVQANFTYTNFKVATELMKVDWLRVEMGEQFEESNFLLSTQVSGNPADGLLVTINTQLGLSEDFVAHLSERFMASIEAMLSDFDAPVPLPATGGLPLLQVEGVAAGACVLRWPDQLRPQLLADVAELCARDWEVSHGRSKGRAALHCTNPEGVDALQCAIAAGRAAMDGVALFSVAHGYADGHSVLAVVADLDGSDADRQHAVFALLRRYFELTGERALVQVAVGAGTDWISWDAWQARVTNWSATLHDAAPTLDLPADGHRSDDAPLHLDSVPALRSTADAIIAWSGQSGGSAQSVWIAAWMELLSRLGSQADGLLGLFDQRDWRPSVVGVMRYRQQEASAWEWIGQVEAARGRALACALPSLSEAVRVLRDAGWGDRIAPFDAGVVISSASASHTVFGCTVVLRLYDEAHRTGAELVFRPDVFSRDTIERWSGHLDMIVGGMIADSSAPMGTLPWLQPAQRQQVVSGFNLTSQPFGETHLIHTLFEAQVRRTSEAIAIEFEGGTLTYGELNRRANQLAHHLVGLGVGPDDRIGVCLERGMDMVVALLGVLKAGGAYVPLDPGYPAARLGYMLADSSPRHVLSVSALQPVLAEVQVPVIMLDQVAALDGQPVHDPDPQALGLTPQHLAYVIYTSGSTGRPKGVMNQHDGVVNRLLWAQEEFALGSEDRVLQKTPFGFDVSVWEFFLPLLAGARLVLARPGGHQDPYYLAGVISSSAISVLHFVPSMLQVFLDEADVSGCAGVRQILCSGEALPAPLQNRLLEALPQVALYNLYGPTEAAVDVTCWRCVAGSDTVPIGRPIANTRIHIVDRHLQPVPIGVAGELLIAGVQVARGYLNQPALTAERFIVDPFDAAGGRVYRSGDLARWRADGSIEYLGRNDSQVKLRGLRIELGEIQAQLAQQPGVREAVVVAREDRVGDKRLVAYLVAEAGATLPTVVLREALSRTLAEYMVPSAFVVLAALPLMANGKLDRHALPAPGLEALTGRAYVAPEGEVEQALAAIWVELLGVERVGRHDHFFELGGHSLVAIQLQGRINQRMLVDVPLHYLFENAALHQLAEHVQSAQLDRFLGNELALIDDELAGLSAEQLSNLLMSEGQ